jgi:hypothetical protein
MTESMRTVIFLGVAAVAALGGWLSQRNTKVIKPPPQRMLFPDFKDPLTAKSLEIVTFDDSTAELKQFKVAQENGRWVIPSHGDYPADAETQLRDAAAGLIDINALAMASEIPSDHAEYGVLEPNQAKLKVGDKGVGTLVAVQDGKGNDLMRLVVGKEVADRPGQRFVRKPSEDVVYVAKFDLAKLPTEFDKWIEKDLLKLSPFDVSKVTLKDYSLVPTQNGTGLLQRMEALLTYDSAATNQWTLDSMVVFSRGSTPTDAPLSDQEELNKQKLDDLRNALDDLKIVDVARKPEALGEALAQGLESVDAEELEALAAFGFLPARGRDGVFDVFASNGELIVDLKDGVRYTLRFGKIAGTEEASSSKGSASSPESEPGDESAADKIKVNRYLFVSAALSPLTLTQPMLEPEPAGPASTPAETPAEKPAAKPPASGGGGAEGQEPDAAKPPVTKAQPKAAVAQEGDEPEAPKTEPAADPAKAERERIKRENDRKLTEYREKKTKAENRVKELNSRFADWYYVVSEDVYKKLRLTRADFVKESATAADEGFGVDAFRKLETGGVEAKATPAPMTPTTPSFSLPPNR